MASGQVSDSENRATELDTGLPRYDVIIVSDVMMYMFLQIESNLANKPHALGFICEAKADFLAVE